jgi:hypothetical protein
LDARSFVFGAVVGATVAAITSLVFRANFTTTDGGQPETVVNRESPRLPDDPSSPREPRNTAQPVAADSGAATSPETAEALSPRDLSALSGDRTGEDWGKQFMAETRDESWASVAENALSDYLARQPYPDALGSPDIECRETLCSIITIVDAAVHQAAPSADLQGAMSNLQYDSLGREFVPLSVALQTNEQLPDQIIMMAIVRRVKPADAPDP